MDGDLSGKVAIVTGGAGGIGKAIGARLAEAGARVCLADLAQGSAAAAAREIGGATFGIELDVDDEASIDRLVASVVEAAGGIDILVGSAGIFLMQKLMETDRSTYDRLFAINTRGLFFTLQAVAHRMIAQGRGGKILNIASGAGRAGNAHSGIYGASKAAVISLTQSCALALAEHRITVNALAPGLMATPMAGEVERLYAAQLGQSESEIKRSFAQAVPFGRIGRPDDLVGAALFLLSPAADYITGQTLNVDGGLFMN